MSRLRLSGLAWRQWARHPWARSLIYLGAAAVATASLVQPAGWLSLALGLAAPLVPLWLAGAALSHAPRPLLPPAQPQCLLGAALLSLTLPPLLALDKAGGAIGALLLEGLVALFGHAAAIFLLLLAASSGLLLALGRRRDQVALLLIGIVCDWLGRARSGRRPARRLGVAHSGAPAAQVPAAQVPAAPSHEPTAGIVEAPQPELVIVRPEACPAAETVKSQPRSAPPPQVTPLPDRHWELPPLDLLSSARRVEVAEADLKAQARIIEETLATFRLPVRVVEVRHGPTVNQFALEPGPGVAVDRIAARSHDLALRLGARSIRTQVPIPGRPLMGIEVPSGETALVTLRETLEQAPLKEWPPLPVALGKDVAGHAVIVDLARLPHLLIAGATGSGKSVGLNALLVSLLMTRTPAEVQFVLVDPKRVELTGYTGVPHLRMPVLTDMELVLGALKWALAEMEERFSSFARAACRNLEAYNQRRAPSQRLPRLVIVIDELADLMLSVPDEVERCLCRLAQLGRAAGIHLVVATQRPSVDVLTGLIKANFPARIAFAVSSVVDSRVVLDTAGAEQLLGRGDMLFLAPDSARPRRIQGAYVEERELSRVIAHWRRQGQPSFGEAETEVVAELGRKALADPEDELLERARALVEQHGRVTASFLQRRLGIGYPKAARLLQRLQDDQPEGDEAGAATSSWLEPAAIDRTKRRHAFEDFEEGRGSAS